MEVRVHALRVEDTALMDEMMLRLMRDESRTRLVSGV